MNLFDMESNYNIHTIGTAFYVLDIFKKRMKREEAYKAEGDCGGYVP